MRSDFSLSYYTCMAINAIISVSVQHDDGCLGIIVSTQCYCHRGTRLNAAMKSFFCLCSLSMIPPKRFDISPPDWGMLRRSTRSDFYTVANPARGLLNRKKRKKSGSLVI